MFSCLKKGYSDRCYAIVVFLLSVGYAALGFQIQDNFFTDPVGPSLWIKGVAFCLIIFSALLFAFPSDYSGNFPGIKEWLNRLPFIAVVFSYAYFLPLLGFAVTTPLMVLLVGIFFKARMRFAVISAVIMTTSVYLIFDTLLGISLPNGIFFK